MFNSDGSGKSVTKEQLFAIGIGEGLEEIPLPEIGGSAYVRPATAREVFMGFAASTEDASIADRLDAQNKLIAKLLVNGKGERLIEDEEADRLNDLPASVYLRIAKAVTAGLTDVTGEFVTPTGGEGEIVEGNV